jgi:hypothetical protein
MSGPTIGVGGASRLTVAGFVKNAIVTPKLT